MVRRGVQRACREQREQIPPGVTNVDLTRFVTVPVVRGSTWLATLAESFNAKEDRPAARRIAGVLDGRLVVVTCQTVEA